MIDSNQISLKDLYVNLKYLYINLKYLDINLNKLYDINETI